MAPGGQIKSPKYQNSGYTLTKKLLKPPKFEKKYHSFFYLSVCIQIPIAEPQLGKLTNQKITSSFFRLSKNEGL